MPVVTFLSDRFSNTPTADAINEMLGKDLSEWLRDGLQQHGFQVGEVIAEDYGYGCWLERNRSHYWITQTQLEPPGYQGEDLPKWLVGIDYDPGCFWIWRLRARPVEGDLIALAQAVQAVLATDPGIREMEWESQETNKGNPGSGL